MSRDQKPERVRMVSSKSRGLTPRRRKSDFDAPIIEIAGDSVKRDAILVSMDGGLGISWRSLATFMMGCALGGVFAAIIGFFWGSFG